MQNWHGELKLFRGWEIYGITYEMFSLSAARTKHAQTVGAIVAAALLGEDGQ